MTALCGLVRFDDDPLEQRFCDRALAALHIYGSGSSRTRSFDKAQFGINLFAALPEDAFDLQPTRLGDRLIVADARLDNRDELIADLGPGIAGGQLSDGDLVALCWERWGTHAPGRIIGDFAIAVYCARDQTLDLVRDVAGERPLFYCEHGGAVAFASMPSGLIADPANWQGFDLEQLAAMLADVRPDSDRSYYKGIRRVLPGERITFRPGGKVSSRIWEPSFGELRMDARDYIAAFRAVLDTAVSARLRRAGGGIAAHLSAGFDSSAVAATAARQIGPAEQVHAYTAAPRIAVTGPMPKDCIADESPLARLTADQHRMVHHVMPGPKRPLAHLRAQAATYQEPHRNVLNGGWDLAIRSAAAKSGQHLLLTGESGNLTLTAGGFDVLATLLAQGRWASWASEALAAVAHTPQARLRGVLYSSFRAWMTPSIEAAIRKRFLGEDRWDAGFLKEEWTRRLRRRPPAAGIERIARDNVRRFETLSRSDPAMVRKGGLAETGTDIRDPLLDRRVIQFSLSLPPEQLFSRGIAWPLARAALADRLPPEIVSTRFRGYQAADWHALVDPAEVSVMIDEIEQSPTARELIDFAKLRRAVAEWPTSGLERADVITRYVARLPGTIAAGYFMLEVERAVEAARRPV